MDEVMKEEIREAEEVGQARIKVVGVGGGGGNAVNKMINEGNTDVDYYTINTDGQALKNTKAKKILIGQDLTKGLGAGANPEIGRKAAEENEEVIRKELEGADLIYISAGMGGGTGTGAAPIVARIAKELDILTIGVITLPFSFEGPRRMDVAIEGKRAMSESVDTLIVIPNDRIAESVKNDRSYKEFRMTDAYSLVDSILVKATEGVTSLIQNKGHINLDFADIHTVIKVGGSSVMGVGESKGEAAAFEAAQRAIENPLFVHSINGAKGIIMNFKTSEDASFFEIQDAAAEIQSKVCEDAVVIFGHVVAEEEDWEDDQVEVTMVATGFEDEETMFRSREMTEETPKKAPGVNPLDIAKERKKTQERRSQELTIERTPSNDDSSKRNKRFNESKEIDSLSQLKEKEGKLSVPSFLKGFGNN